MLRVPCADRKYQFLEDNTEMNDFLEKKVEGLVPQSLVSKDFDKVTALVWKDFY